MRDFGFWIFDFGLSNGGVRWLGQKLAKVRHAITTSLCWPAMPRWLRCRGIAAAKRYDETSVAARLCPSHRPSRRGSPLAACSLFALALIVSGCSEGIETSYGHRSGIVGGDSVNGTAVLARMFTAAGHHVTTATKLSPRVYETADCIVWAPNDFKPPSAEVRQWFNAWWRHGEERTLIYIGRDYDAAPAYWRAVQSAAPPAKRAEMKRRLARDQNDFLSARNEMPQDEDCEWFTARGKRQQRQVATLSGAAHWICDIDAKKVDIELNGRLVPPPDAELLVESEGDAIVSRQEMSGDGSLIVVVNGSFLLNMPLVNQENRKLAGLLVDEIGPASQEVVFLESGPDGPRIWEDEPPEHARTSLEILTVWPFNVIFLQLGALGLIFCYSRFPIFGRPRPLAAPRLSDFGRHIAALASLLERTGDRAYALNRVAHYQQTVRREPGRFRRSTATSATAPHDRLLPNEPSDSPLTQE